jgi:hypothetical protein
MRFPAAPFLLSVILTAAPAGAATTQTPQPFPKPGSTTTTTDRPASNAAPAKETPQAPRGAAPATTAGTPTPPPPAAAGAAGAEAPPTAATLGLPLPPGAQFLASYDAGQGQRYFLFGSASNFTEVLNFYRTALKQRGDVVFEEPATHIFEVGRFREESMAFPPGVVVKDYMWGNIGGYANPKPGAQPARFATVIQIVPVPAADRER